MSEKIKYLCLFLSIIFVIYMALILVSYYEHYILEKEIDDIFHSEIYPKSTSDIDGIIQKMADVQDPELKLQLLSKWIQDDFIFSLNNKSFSRDDYIYYILTNNNKNYYISNPEGRRVIRAGKFSNNPYCIAYYRAGACGEYATLAQHVAMLSGLNARKVSDPSGYHGWVEVEINGTWYFYDPTYPPNPRSNSWFGLRSENTNNSVIRNSAQVFYNDEDITHYYPPTGTLIVNGLSTNDLIELSWMYNNGIHKFRFIPQNETYTLTLRPREYTIEVQRFWFLFSDKQQINITEGFEREIKISPSFFRLDFTLFG